MNNVASGLGDLVCVGLRAFDIGILSASCTARSSTINIGYFVMTMIGIFVLTLLVKSRRTI